MAYNKKPMSENEKKAKLTALKDANKTASNAMRDNMTSYGKKDSPELKKHVKSMSDDSKIDFKNDSESIKDPTHYGNVVGRHISDEDIDCEPESDSKYNIDELDARIRDLMEQKHKIMRK